ncbi:SRPBCC family protein [Nocardiopsis tropica]|jgi:uncharacterized protein YndB with AHSA1/START domain|uniref:SRPBCC family protein n=1 Tax=Nocardiopsis tropica TaxID=109330 RepID=A0ABU7L0H7_9ACTN|nr:SRPBCC family protein [Nocardiopsis umidischolae]MEE2054832.1 SRPBCC family protein [Nocardiopsis umidischolae]
MDIEHEIDAVGRSVGVRRTGSGAESTVTVSRAYDVPVEDLWDACTNPERIPRWFLPVAGDLREGGAYQLEGNAGGRVLSCDPPRSFRVTWEYGGESSEVGVRLTAESGARSRFELSHTAPLDEFWERYGPGAGGIGWDLGLFGLTLYLLHGASVPPEAGEWAGTEEARRFTELSGRRWATAHAESGEDPDRAEDAADRTIDFYTAPPQEGRA